MWNEINQEIRKEIKGDLRGFRERIEKDLRKELREIDTSLTFMNKICEDVKRKSTEVKTDRKVLHTANAGFTPFGQS